MVLTSFTEVISIGAALPFLAALTSAEHVFQNQTIKYLMILFELNSSQEVMIFITVIFICAALIAGLMRLSLLWGSSKLAFAAGADLSIDVYRRTLYQEYEVHCTRNSSEIINAVLIKSNDIIYNVIVPILTLISSFILLIAILGALLYFQPVVALCTFASLGLIYGLIIFMTREQQLLASKKIASNSTIAMKSLQEGLGGIRDVLIHGVQELYCEIYAKTDLPLRLAQGRNQFISQSPRYLMEALGMIVIASLGYVMSTMPGGINQSIPILGAFALGAQRLLPVIQQGYVSWSSILGNQTSLRELIGLLEQPLPTHISNCSVTPVSFKNEIALKNISFSYANEKKLIINNISLRIEKGR